MEREHASPTILGRFAEDRLSGLSDVQIADFEALMSEHDRDLLMWFTGEAQFPFEDLQAIFDLVQAHVLDRHNHA